MNPLNIFVRLFPITEMSVCMEREASGIVGGWTDELANTMEPGRLTFDGGELHPRIPIPRTIGRKTPVIIESLLANSDCLMEVLLVADAIRRQGFDDIRLLAPYIPGGRQDRVQTTGEPLSVKVYADVINSAGFTKVYTLDNHSMATDLLIRNNVPIPLEPILAEFMEDADCLVAPDAGATKKVYKYAKHFEKQFVQADKIRNPQTGELELVSIKEFVGGDHCVVIDDICDGGATFVRLGEKLRREKAARLTLIVSHGIFSNGTTKLADYYDRIITINPFKHPCETKGWKNFEVRKLRRSDIPLIAF